MSEEIQNPIIDKKLTTILKGYSILTVIFGHMISCTGIFPTNSIVYNSYFRVLICPTDVGMGLFLFLSGYGLYQSYRSRGLTNYWESKIRRVWLPYFCVQLIWWIHAYFTTGLIWPKEQRVLSLFGIWPRDIFDESMWYISYQLFWYFIFFVGFLLFKEYGTVLIGIVSILCCMGLGNLWTNYSDRFCFLAGVLFALLEAKVVKMKINITWKNVLLAILLTIILRLIRYKFYNVVLTNIALPLIVVCYIAIGKKIFEKKSLVKKCFIEVGNISYLLYLLEMKLIVDFSKYLVYKKDLFDYWIYLYIGLFVVTILIAIIINKFVRILSELVKLKDKKEI